MPILAHNYSFAKNRDADDNVVIGMVENVLIKYSNNAKIIATIQSQKWLQYKNGDYEFPTEIHINIFNKEHELIMTLHANKAYRYEEKKLWLLLGDVEITAFNKDKNLHQVNTELMYWDQDKEILYNNNFVRIESESSCFTGNNFFARQNFSYYKMDKVEGYTMVDKQDF